jgi:uncharacterized protein YndB with AHSA1/START domain
MPTLEDVQIEAAARIEASTRVVEQTRLIRASRARIFAAWTKPELLQQWFGPSDRICTVAESDPRVGGAYRIGVRLKDVPDAQVAVATGHFLQFIPNQLLQFNWIPSWNPGEESLVTVSLEHVSGGTEVTLRHEDVPPESFNGYDQGWHGSLTKLAKAVERL